MVNRLRRAWAALKTAPEPPPPDLRWDSLRAARDNISDFYRTALDADMWVSLHYADTMVEIADRVKAELRGTRGNLYTWQSVSFSCPVEAVGRELRVGLCQTRTSRPLDDIAVGAPGRKREPFFLWVTPTFEFPANHKRFGGLA